MQTLGDLKAAVRKNIFPTGEAPNLVAPHNKSFIDCLIDLQTVVECLQVDNTDIYPQCSTFYDCEMTVLPAPRGNIKSVSVIDKLGAVDSGTITATLADTTITASDLIFTSNMVGGMVVFDSGLSFVISGFTSETVVTVILPPVSPPPPPITDEHFIVTGCAQEISSASPDDWCRRIYYNEIDPCHFVAWKRRGGCSGGCHSPYTPWALPFHFGLPWPTWDCWGCHTNPFPATNAGLPAGLAPLPLGLKYAQTSTDRVTADGKTRWRSRYGVWSKERGNIWIAPWIQSTETVIVVWDGIKRTWTDDDQVDDDPLLSQAIEDYVRWRHEDKYGRDPETAGRAAGAYALAKQALIHQCREETRQRGCEPSHARSSVPSLQTSQLFYNSAQTGSASCPDGTGTVSVTIAAGSVSSTISVADANQKALAQANQQAQAKLVCEPVGEAFRNTPQTYTAQCVGEAGAPLPDGNPVTVTVPAGTFTSQTSQADANAQALAQAQLQASSQLQCTWWNIEKTVTLVCPTDGTISATYTVPAHTFSSNVSQDDADSKASAAANNGATAALALTCPAGGVVWNTDQKGSVRWPCGHLFVTVNWEVMPHYVSGPTLTQANATARTIGEDQAKAKAISLCNSNSFGIVTITLP